MKYLPDNLEVGPFCPATLDEAGGIWHWDGDEAGLYRIDGDFLRMLDEQGYTFFNEDGEVYTFDIRTRGTDRNQRMYLCLFRYRGRDDCSDPCKPCYGR